MQRCIAACAAIVLIFGPDSIGLLDSCFSRVLHLFIKQIFYNGLIVKDKRFSTNRSMIKRSFHKNKTKL